VNPQEVRRYHRPRYIALIADLAVAVAVPAVLALVRPHPDWAWWLAAPLLALGVVWASAFVRLPIDVWRGWVHERRFGFSTQRLGGFLGDWAKGQAVGGALVGTAFLGLVALARWLPDGWPLVAAPLAALAVALLGFVAPIVLEPLFNRFEPLGDGELAAELRSLAERARVPVRDVLVADASRRTRKVNAYVSGLGATRRVVVFDTLLGRMGTAELHVVVAHELGHRRFRHPAKGTLLGMAGAVGAVAVLWLVLGEDAAEPASAPLAILVATLLVLAATPPLAALSRRWERACDLFALELTRDLQAFVAAFETLADANLADPDPPRVLYLLLFTHPTVPERIRAARSATVPA